MEALAAAARTESQMRRPLKVVRLALRVELDLRFVHHEAEVAGILLFVAATVGVALQIAAPLAGDGRLISHHNVGLAREETSADASGAPTAAVLNMVQINGSEGS